MHYQGYDIAGEHELEPYAAATPGRVVRVIEAIERFIQLGPTMGTRLYPVTLDEPHPRLSVHLVPPRAILRGVPDMGAIVLVDQGRRIIRLLDVVEEYGGDDATQWTELSERAERRISDYL